MGRGAGDESIAGEVFDESATRPSRLRAWRFEVGLVVVILMAAMLAWMARSAGDFPLDVRITRAIQSIDHAWIVTLLHGVAWIGFPPQSNVIFGLVIVILFLVGLRLEAAMTLFAAAGSAGLWFWLAPLIDRPRPSPDMVRVAMDLPTGGFPSGHVLNLTAIFGFLVYLAIVSISDVRWRALLVAALCIPILTIGISRVYDGAHWPSDVLGGYLIGAIWLALTIRIYQQLRSRFGHARVTQTDVSDRHGDSAGPPKTAAPA
jgi:membrane-associated phospholipid phosphatase